MQRGQQQQVRGCVPVYDDWCLCAGPCLLSSCAAPPVACSACRSLHRLAGCRSSVPAPTHAARARLHTARLHTPHAGCQEEQRRRQQEEQGQEEALMQLCGRVHACSRVELPGVQQGSSGGRRHPAPCLRSGPAAALPLRRVDPFLDRYRLLAATCNTSWMQREGGPGRLDHGAAKVSRIGLRQRATGEAASPLLPSWPPFPAAGAFVGSSAVFPFRSLSDSQLAATT